MEKNISQLPMHVLTKVVQHLPIAQWPSLESVDGAFRNATFQAWKKLGRIDLEADFVFDHRLLAENEINVLNLLLEKLLVRAPKITGLDGLDEFRGKWLVNSTSILLAEFSHLESVRFSGILISHLNLARFLNISKSRSSLKELDLMESFLPRSMITANLQHGEAELHLAFGQHSDLPPLQLEYFNYKLGYREYPSLFLDNIDETNLKELCLDVTRANQNNIISLLNRCTKLANLKLKMVRNTMQILPSIALSHTLSTLAMEYYAVCPEHHAALANFIANLGRYPYHLTELLLIGNHCQDVTVQYIAYDYQHLRSVHLDISVCQPATLAQLLLIKLEDLENLQLEGVNLAHITEIAPLISQLKKLKCLHISVSPQVTIPLELTIALCSLDRLKELRLVRIHITDEIITHLVENDQVPQLESLDITSSSVSEAGIISLLEKLPKLRRLNLRNTGITDDVLHAITKSCPFLLQLNISFCNFTQTGIQAVIDGCPSLKKIFGTGANDKKKWYPQNLQAKKYRKIIFQ